jgi:hypothetical protein
MYGGTVMTEAGSTDYEADLNDEDSDAERTRLTAAVGGSAFVIFRQWLNRRAVEEEIRLIRLEEV